MSSFSRPDDHREALVQLVDHLLGVVERERRLRDIGEVRLVADLHRVDVLGMLDQDDRAFRQLAEGADDLGMAGMADEQDLTAALEVDLRLAVHLGDQRARRIDRVELAPSGLGRDRLRHAVRGEDHRLVGIRHLGELLDEDRALRFQPLDDVFVVHDLVAHVDRRAVEAQRLLHSIDRPHHAGAETARRTEKDAQLGLGRNLARHRVEDIGVGHERSRGPETYDGVLGLGARVSRFAPVPFPA